MKRTILIFSSIIILIVLIIAFVFYNRFTKEIVNLDEGEIFELYIETGSGFNDVKDSLYKHDIIIDTTFFELLAKKKNYPDNVKPGRYIINPQLSANTLINMLKSGSQTPVMLTFNTIRYLPELAEQASKYIEASENEIYELITSGKTAEKYGFKEETFISMFIPNTYEFYWNTDASEFVERMHIEYTKFWDDAREKKLNELGFTKVEVSIIASIVQQETNKKDEMSKIAGLYINRLNKGMFLQADPTVRYALDDHSIKRVLYSHLEHDSPYNTYVYKGLPPGPICMPEIYAIKSVLNYKEHKYLFMCAKADGSGYHAFARTNREHERNARAYHNYLNKN